MSGLKNRNATDIVLLAFVRVITILGNFLSVAILSRALSLGDYGTYSAGNLIVSVAASATLFGFSDAGNYYFNLNTGDREKYINTIFFLQLIMGLACAAVILGCNNAITGYFNNPKLNGIYIYIAFRPMLSNLIVSLLPLQTAVGKARSIAFWNIIVMAFKLTMVAITAYLTEDVLTIFIGLLIVDTVTVVFYLGNFRKYAFGIKVFRFDSKLIKEILQFSIPMGIYILANSLMKDMDKLVIGYYETPGALAIYTNCSSQLPVGIITTAFLTVALPYITRSVQQNDNLQAKKLCRAYMKIGYLTTTVLGMACIVLASEAIQLLYGEKYLSGRWIFILYILVDIIKFANTTIILTAKGRTKTLMNVSLVSLAANAVLNIVMYKAVGFIGPAAATVAVSIATTVWLVKLSAETISAKATEILDLRCIAKLLAWIAVISAAAVWLRKMLLSRDVHYMLILLLVGVVYCGILFAVNYKEITSSFKILDNN